MAASDYGNVFHRIWHHFGYADIDPRSTVIITGDCQEQLSRVGGRDARYDPGARKVYWLNPEPRSEWNTSDSIMDVSAPACHAVFETRNLRQLAGFVYAIT